MWWNDMSTLQQAMFIIACVATAVLILQIIFMLVGGSHDTDITAGGASDADIAGGGAIDNCDALNVGDVPSGDFDAGVPDGGFDGDISGADFDGDTDVSNVGKPSDAIGSGSGAAAAFGLRLLSLRSIIAFVTVGSWVCYTLCYPLEWYIALIIAVVCGFAAACGMAGAMVGMERLQTSGNINPQNAIGKIGTVYLTIPPARSGRGKVNVLVQERYVEYEAITSSGDPIPTSTEIKVTGYAGANVLIVEKYKKPSITVTTE